MSKSVNSAKRSKTTTSTVAKTNPHVPIPKFDLSKLNLLPVPRDGEWCCNWVNETPVGIESHLEWVDGYKKPTVIVEDWRLPVGWTKHLYPRPNDIRTWEVLLVSLVFYNNFFSLVVYSNQLLCSWTILLSTTSF